MVSGSTHGPAARSTFAAAACTVLAVVHSGGGRAKALATQLRDLGAQTHDCAKITKPAERANFVRAEFRAHLLDQSLGVMRRSPRNDRLNRTFKIARRDRADLRDVAIAESAADIAESRATVGVTVVFCAVV
mgnify:CR=1 FL=1